MLLDKISSKKTLDAIMAGCKNEDSVYELEPLGVAYRTAGLLEANGVLFLSELIRLSINDIRAMRDLDMKGVNEIVHALQRYEQLETKRIAFIKAMFVCREYLKGGLYDYTTGY